MDKACLEKVAEYIASQVEPEDLDDLLAELPGRVRKIYLEQNVLKNQLTSNWRHFRNWYQYAAGDCLKEILLMFNIVWLILFGGSAGAIFGIFMTNLTTSELDMPSAVGILAIITGIFLILPWSICLIKWRRFAKKNPWSLRPYWVAKDYLK